MNPNTIYFWRGRVIIIYYLWPKWMNGHAPTTTALSPGLQANCKLLTRNVLRAFANNGDERGDLHAHL